MLSCLVLKQFAVLSEPKLLRAYRERLVQNRLTHPLFDTDRFRCHIEEAYRRMWELWQRGEKPTSFAVASRGLEIFE